MIEEAQREIVYLRYLAEAAEDAVEASSQRLADELSVIGMTLSDAEDVALELADIVQSLPADMVEEIALRAKRRVLHGNPAPPL